MSREGWCIHSLLGRRATSSPFFFYSSTFSLFFFLPHWTENVSSKWIHLYHGHILFLQKTSIMLEVRKWILDFGMSGRVGIKKRISGPPLTQIQVRKGTHTSGMQPEQGSWLESGAGWGFSPHTPQPGALVQEMTVQTWGKPWVDLHIDPLYSSQNLNEDHKKYSMPCCQTHFDEWYLRKHIIAKSFLDTQMVAGLKVWQRREGGELSKPAHWIELELPGRGRAWCLLVSAPDKTTLSQALRPNLQDFEVINCPSKFVNRKYSLLVWSQVLSHKKPQMVSVFRTANVKTVRPRNPTPMVFSQCSCLTLKLVVSLPSTYASFRDFQNVPTTLASASFTTKPWTLVFPN